MLRLVLSFLLAPRVCSGGPAAPEYGAANDIAACDVALGAGTCGQDTVEGIQPYDGADAGDVAAVRTTLLQKRTSRRGGAAPPPCPFLDVGTPPDGHVQSIPNDAVYKQAVQLLDISQVVKDIQALLTSSQDCWPADWGNYGPFFIRLAWHCSGSYRGTDGAGGCAGGRMRFPPEATWEDNANLEKARALLVPIKEKYGHGLSWGDLFVTAGTTAIWSMGGPAQELCLGRVDDADNSSSLVLGPSKEQEAVAPCTGKPCMPPLGSVKVGLIYVHPDGVDSLGADGKWTIDPDPVLLAGEVREVFARMNMNDTETVALIGGGHAFGQAHVYTSGFSGPWTTTPTKWSNEYFQVLMQNKWETYSGPGGKLQWRVSNAESPFRSVMRFTSDIALISDDAYKAIVGKFAREPDALDSAFAAAWLKLTTAGKGWIENTKCYRRVPLQ